MKELLNGPAFGIILMIIAFVLVGVIYNRIAKKYYSVCPKCGEKFKASPMELIFTFHVFYSFYLKCPQCGKRSLIKQIEEK